VRLYFTSAELTALMGATNSQGQGSGVTGIGNIKVMKNSDATPVSLTAATSIITPTYAEAHSGTSNGGYVLQADISSFSSFYFGDPSMITLPLELISFKGIMKENDAHLNWETANEYNTAHFNVERSVDGHKYSYIDYDADKQSSSVLYYRLKMVDKDDDFKQSQIISLAINSSAVPVLVYPNPVNDVLNLRVSLAGNDRVHIQVSDMQGQIIYRKSKYIRNGGEEININTKSWPAQSYSIIVTDSRNKVLVNKKIIKM
jgi:hypothetical protein